MKKFIIYSKKLNFNKSIKHNIITRSNFVFISTLIAAGLIIGSTAIIMSDELLNIMVDRDDRLGSELYNIVAGNLFGIVLLLVTYLLTAFSSVGVFLILPIPIIYGIITGMHFAYFLLGADIIDICVYLLIKLPAVTFRTITVLYLTVFSLDFSEKIFRNVFLNQKEKINFNNLSKNIFRLLPLSCFSVLLEIIYFIIKNISVKS